MTGPLKLADGSAGAPALAFNTAATTGLYKSTGGMGVAVSGSKVFDFQNGVASFVDGGDIASANALTLGTGNLFNITGTTAVTSIGTKGVGTVVWLRFDGALALTHHATDLILLTGANITTAAGDWAVFEEYASGDWRMVNYARANGNALKTAVAPPSSFKNLSIKVASNTTVTVAADFVVTTDGTFFQTTAVSSTVDLSTTGADALDTGTIAIDTWYAIWVIAKADGTTKCLASASFSSPTMPSGYTFKARVGAVQTIHGSATLYGSWQLGRRAQYVVGLAQTAQIPNIVNGTAGTFSTTSPVLATASVSRFVPPTASRIDLAIYNAFGGQSPAGMLVAPNTSWGGTNQGPSGSNGMVWPAYRASNDANTAINVSLLLEATTIAWCSSAAGGGVSCMGWEDNI